MRFAFAAALTLLALAQGAGGAQDITLKKGPRIDLTDWLRVPGLEGEHAVRIVAPNDFAQRVRSRTARSVEIEVPQGKLRDALSRMGKAGGRLGTVHLRMQVAPGSHQWIELHSVQCSTCRSIASTASTARVWLQFHEDFVIQGSRGDAQAQEGDLASGAEIFIVWASDEPTRQLIRSREQGAGRMTIAVERDSELAKRLRAQLATRPRRPIAQLHLEFAEALIAEVSMPSADSPRRAVLQEVQVVRVQDKTAAGRPVSEALISYARTRW